MRKTRVTFLVSVNLDPVPGRFDDAQDFERTLREWADRFPWYVPTVQYVGEREATAEEGSR